MKAWNSNIEIKTCRCGCGKLKKFGLNGYASLKCMPPELRALPKYKTNASYFKSKRVNLGNLSRKVHLASELVNGQETAKNTSKLALDVWFYERRKDMKGICACGCGQKTTKDDDKLFKHSCAHVLKKSIFKSIATHPENCIELAFYGGCHTTFDDMGYEHCKRTEPKLWAIVVQKLKILYPCISENEKGKIPEILLSELKS